VFLFVSVLVCWAFSLVLSKAWKFFFQVRGGFGLVDGYWLLGCDFWVGLGVRVVGFNEGGSRSFFGVS